MNQGSILLDIGSGFFGEKVIIYLTQTKGYYKSATTKSTQVNMVTLSNLFSIRIPKLDRMIGENLML